MGPRRCQLAAQNQMAKYRVYKVTCQRNADRPVTAFYSIHPGRSFRGAWRVAFMHGIVAAGPTFEQAIANARSIIAEAQV